MDESEYLVCQKCGSRDVSKVSPEVVSPVADGTEKGGNDYGRGDDSARNQASVIFGDFPLVTFSNCPQYYDSLNTSRGFIGARNGAQSRITVHLAGSTSF